MVGRTLRDKISSIKEDGHQHPCNSYVWGMITAPESLAVMILRISTGLKVVHKCSKSLCVLKAVSKSFLGTSF